MDVACIDVGVGDGSGAVAEYWDDSRPPAG